ncbi:hypothetical protein F5H01DRAFT_72550 [Linnemannia elongata]|nr:hypothetical protein F5H01DRAFT_72550 [Linnemannia elongata]
MSVSSVYVFRQLTPSVLLFVSYCRLLASYLCKYCSKVFSLKLSHFHLLFQSSPSATRKDEPCLEGVCSHFFYKVPCHQKESPILAPVHMLCLDSPEAIPACVFLSLMIGASVYQILETKHE